MIRDNHGVPPTLAAQLRAAHTSLTSHARDTLRRAVAIGTILSGAKGRCRHGEWSACVKEHYPGSLREAQRYMRLQAAYPDPADIPRDLSLRQALALLAQSPSEKHVLLHETITRDGAARLETHLGRMLHMVNERVVCELEVEGLTPQHALRRKAERLRALVRSLREDTVAHATPAPVMECSSAQESKLSES